MSNGSDDKRSGSSLRERGRNWSVEEYYCLLRAADAIYNKTPEGKRAFALSNEETLQEEFERQTQDKGRECKRDGKTLHRTLDCLKGLHKLIRDKLPHELPVNAPDGFFWRKGTKRLWDCFRDPDFREVCDAVMFKIDAPPSSVIGGSTNSLGVVDVQPVTVDPTLSQDEAAKAAAQKIPPHPSRYYSSVRLYPSVGSAQLTPTIDPAAVERLTYIVESQQANINDMLTKLYQMHQEQLQQQTQQAQQLNASLQALLGESERYFHEVVQINQQLVGQLRDLFAATVQGAAESAKGVTQGADDKDDESRAKRRKEAAPAK